MAIWVIVQRSDLQILGSYVADSKDDSSANRSYTMAEPLAASVQLPDGMSADTISASLVDGNIVLQTDDAKVAAKLATQWSVVRAQRDALLAACDWTQLPDAPLSSMQKNDYLSYRQALRDVPQHNPDPFNVVWPRVQG